MQGDRGLMHLQRATQDERVGFPSASEYERLLRCRASYLLSRKAQALGQVAHQWSQAAEEGTRKHLASTQGPEILSEGEREDWEICQRKREKFIKGWLGPAAAAGFISVREERLWLRRGIRPLLTGKPDEVLKARNRAAVLDLKYGRHRVADPGDNVQLSIYALLVSREDDATQEVTCQILSPHFDFKPYTYGRAELDRLYPVGRDGQQFALRSRRAFARRSLPVLPGPADLSRGEERSGKCRAHKSDPAALEESRPPTS
jgi:hypothetical protein